METTTANFSADSLLVSSRAKPKKIPPVKVDDSPVKRPRGPFVHWPYVPSMFNIVGLIVGLLIAYLITNTMILPLFQERGIVGWGSFASVIVFIVVGSFGLAIMWTISRALRKAFPAPAIEAPTTEHSAPRET